MVIGKTDTVIAFKQVATPGVPETVRLPLECSVKSNEDMAITISPWPETAWLGASRQDIDGDGWKCKGAFFGGPKNLSNGGALLKGHWVDSPRSLKPEAIRMTVDRTTEADRISIYYDYMLQGQWYSLGQAFDVSEHYLQNNAEDASEEWYPVIRYDSETYKKYNAEIETMRVSCVKADKLPKTKTRQLPAPAANDVTGSWSLVKLFVGPELGEPSIEKDLKESIVFNITEDGGLSFKAGNNYRGVINGIEDVQYASTAVDGFHHISLGPLSGTRMMVAGPMKQIEDLLSKYVPNITKVHHSDDTMILKGADIEIELGRKVESAIAFTA